MPLYVEPIDTREGGTSPEQVEERVDRGTLPLDLHLDPTVVQVANPSPQAGPGGHFPDEGAVGHALHAPGYQHAGPHR